MYVLDSNILVGYVRDAPYSHFVDQEYAPLDDANYCAVSVVTRGEILSAAYQFAWGERKRRTLNRILNDITAIGLHPEIVDRYAEIDAYSQNALPERPLGDSDRNMGKNDIWIAATASVIDATLITTDRDFDHLDGEFLDVRYVDPGAHPGA